jgi:uncharacterized membrane protein
MALLYVLAGIRHFTHPGFYMPIMPHYPPWHAPIVFVSGVAEVALGVGLVIPRTTRLAAWGVIALLIAVFPANIYMWTADVHIDGQAIPPFFHAIRLPMQAVLIAWAFWHTRPSAPAAATARAAAA